MKPGHCPRLFICLLWGLWGCAAPLEPDAGQRTESQRQDGGSPAVQDAGEAPDAGSAAWRQELAFDTSDGLTLAGYLLRGPYPNGLQPGVVLIHQFQQSVEQWGDFPRLLAEEGYAVLAFDLRGHGASDAYAQPLANLLTDAEGAPNDMRAAIDTLKSTSGIDPSRLAVVGTSIGANLAVVASIEAIASTSVAISARIPPVEALAGTPAVGMRSVFYVAALNDPGGQSADAQTMIEATASPAETLITEGSAHGIALLDAVPQVRARVLTWLAEHL